MPRKTQTTFIAAVIIAAATYFLNLQLPDVLQPETANGGIDTSSVDAAFSAKRSDVIVTGTASVIKDLPDDNEGSRHQRFLLRMASGRTLLVAHNIDLAPRIAQLQAGDLVGFKGEYEWNSKGGVLHWTHKDPKGWHENGWLEHEGRRYW